MSDWDYSNYLSQVDAWPSEGAEEDVSIWNMSAQHAIAAFHKLNRWADNQRDWTRVSVRRTNLAQALLEQAVGEKVVYAADLAPAPLDGAPHPLADVPLESVYDALLVLDRASTMAAADGKALHPITRARIVLDELTKETT